MQFVHILLMLLLRILGSFRLNKMVATSRRIHRISDSITNTILLAEGIGLISLAIYTKNGLENSKIDRDDEIKRLSIVLRTNSNGYSDIP